MRDLHLYVGLFVSPFIVLYAAGAVLFNHGWMLQSEAAPESYTAAVILPEETDSIQLAKAVLRQIGVRGEIGNVRRDVRANRVIIPVDQPGQTTRIVVDVAAGVATVERQDRGLRHALTYLHLMPGQHLVAIRGNWVFMRLWRWMTDATVYLILFSTVSGIYLWLLVRADRRAGLVALGAGVLSFLVAVFAVVG